MKQLICLILGIIFSFTLYAQDIILNFQAIDDQDQIDEIVLTNITQDLVVVINDPDQPFNFSQYFVGIESRIETDINSGISVYPNPGNSLTTVSIISEKNQSGVLKVIGLDGKLMITEELMLKTGRNNVKLQIAESGLFIVMIHTDSSIKSAKYLNRTNTGSVNSVVSISYDQNVNPTAKTKTIRNGDWIILEAHSGDHTTIVTDQVDDSKTYWFDFFECEDMDYNNYATVQIGVQWWMAENLRTTKFNDGSNVPYIENNVDWTFLNDSSNGEGMSWYSNNEQHADLYGGLYSYNAATNSLSSDENQGICPAGWRLPKQEDWQNLVNFLTTAGNEDEPANVLKSTENWVNNQNLTNKYGFSAMPGGKRDASDGTFSGLNELTSWWVNGEFDDNKSWSTVIDNLNTNVMYETDSKVSGKSVRCISNGSSGVVEDGFYVTGAAVGGYYYSSDIRMTIARNEINQIERPELHELYLTLRADVGFSIVEVNGTSLNVYGPGEDFQLIMNPTYDEPDPGTFWRGSAEKNTEMFQVPEDGLYHIVYDEEVNVAVIAKVNWAMIGSATLNGWAFDTEMQYQGFEQDSAIFQCDSVLLKLGGYKYRYSGGWKIEIDTTDSNWDDHIKINTNLGGYGGNLFPGGANISIDDPGVYNVKLIWDKANHKFIEELIKVGDFYDYSDVELGLIGDGLIFDGYQWNWDSGAYLHDPDVDGSIFTWSWENVGVTTEGSFKIREGQDWNGYSFGYHDVTMAGNAASYFQSIGGGNFTSIVDQEVNIIFTIDALTNTCTFTVNNSSNLIDGFYIVGPAIEESLYEGYYRMTTAINAVDQTERQQLHELYITLKGNTGFNIVEVVNSNEIVHGPSSDFQLVVNPAADEPESGTFYRGSALETPEMFQVPDTGLYHVVYDEELNRVVLAKVNWGMIGQPTQDDWNSDTAMIYQGFSLDSAKYVFDSILLTPGEYKYLYNGGWRIEIDVTDPNPENHIKINTNLGTDGDQILPGESNFNIYQVGYYDIELLWDKNSKEYTETKVKIADVELGYENTELALIGEAIDIDGNSLGWETDWEPHAPVVDGDLYTWSWDNVSLIATGGFKIREAYTWSGLNFGYHNTVIEGDAAGNIIEHDGGNFATTTDQIVNIIFTIDATTDIKTFTVNSAK